MEPNSSQWLQLKMYEKDSEPFRKVMFTNGILSCIVNGFVIFLIVKKTPCQMNVYRWYLLNIAFWSGLFDVYMGIIFGPQLMFPATAVCANGLLGVPTTSFKATISFCIFIILMGGTGMSVFSAFLYRLSTVADKTHWIHGKGTVPLLIGIHMIYTLPTCIFPILAAHRNPELVRDDLVENYPALHQFSATHSCFFFSWKTVKVSTGLFFSFALFEIVLCILVVFALRIIVMRKIEELKDTMSKRTLDLHRQLTHSLSIQFMVPEFFLVIPFTLVIVLILTGNNGTRFSVLVGHSLMVFSSMHSIFNAFSMIIFTGPYRRACLAPFKRWTKTYLHPISIIKRGTLPTTDSTQHRHLDPNVHVKFVIA